MTTLAALATKDALVMGCDSLGSVTKWMIDPWSLVNDYFDPSNNYKLKTDINGNPLLQNFNDFYNKSELIPYNHMTDVTKLFSLEPLPMGVMTTGIASIGSRTIKSIIREFKAKQTTLTKGRKPNNYTVNSIGKKLLAFIMPYYDAEFSQQVYKPVLELMIGGYDKQKHIPYTYRIYVHENKLEPIFTGAEPFGVAFGGQMSEIQRIVFGTDNTDYIRLIERVNELFNKYRNLCNDYLETKGIHETLPEFHTFDELSLFKDWNLTPFKTNWGDFSNRNAIECVIWFVGIMIKSHEFSSHLPTVGGKIHIGLITKDNGFTFISNQEYIHEGHKTAMEDL